MVSGQRKLALLFLNNKIGKILLVGELISESQAVIEHAEANRYLAVVLLLVQSYEHFIIVVAYLCFLAPNGNPRLVEGGCLYLSDAEACLHISTLLYLLLGGKLAVFKICSLFRILLLELETEITIGNDTHKTAAVGTRLFAVALLFDAFNSFFNGIYDVSSSAVGYTDAMKSGVIPLVLQSIFALLSAVYFFVLASDFSKGTTKAYKRKILATAPVCWAGARLIFRFLRQISFIQVSDLLLELVMIAFMVMFFMALAQVASGVYVDNFKWRIPAFGLSAALVGAVLNVPRLIFTFVNSELINSDHPFCLADLVFVIFIVTLMSKIKEDAKRPSSAEYENKAE